MALAPEDATTVPDGMNVPLEPRPHLYVCVSCRRRGAEPVAEGEQTDGRRLYDAVKALADEMGKDAPAQVLPTLCFANCERGCSVGLSAPGKWSYLVPAERKHAAISPMRQPTPSRDRRGVAVWPAASLQAGVIARFPFEPARTLPMTDAPDRVITGFLGAGKPRSCAICSDRAKAPRHHRQWVGGVSRWRSLGAAA
jgi:predicted metal-binding protein